MRLRKQNLVATKRRNSLSWVSAIAVSVLVERGTGTEKAVKGFGRSPECLGGLKNFLET